LYLSCAFVCNKTKTAMASVKIVLRKKRNKDGSYPLAVRITKDRKSSFVHLGHHVEESYWDEKNGRVRKSHPNSVRLNNLLAKKLAEAEDNLLDLEIQKNDTSSHVIKRRLTSNKGTSFFAQADIRLKNLKDAGKYNVYNTDFSRVKIFREYMNGHDIAFQDITVAFLTKFKAYLKGVRQVGEQTTVNYLTLIQKIFNQAIGSNIIDSKHYPFGKGKIRLKPPRSLKIGLTAEEVKLVGELELPADSYLNHARNVWLVSFYFAGMRASDVLRLKTTDFQNDRLYYAMGKNTKGDSLKIPAKAAMILAKYQNEKHKYDLIFPDLETVIDFNDAYEQQKHIRAVINKLDKALKSIAAQLGITKILTMHIARHTFGNISGDKISIQMLQKLYRHSDITTTIGYQANFIHKDTDEALDAVIDF
jgi:integrase/recombinase XerD